MNIPRPKFIVGSKVLIYKAGKLVEKIVSMVEIKIYADSWYIGYKFKEEKSDFFSGLYLDYTTSEIEVFESLEDFNKMQTA